MHGILATFGNNEWHLESQMLRGMLSQIFNGIWPLKGHEKDQQMVFFVQPMMHFIFTYV
jgi:hypothetical protein